MTIQHILTLSIDAIALSFVAMMAADFVLGLLEAWSKSSQGIFREESFPPKMPPRNVAPKGICAEILKPIFEKTETFGAEESSAPKVSKRVEVKNISPAITSFTAIADPWMLPTHNPLLIPKTSITHFKKQKELLLLPEAKPVSFLTKSLPIDSSDEQKVQRSIRQLKKQASAAKIKNYNVMTKAQLIQALSA